MTLDALALGPRLSGRRIGRPLRVLRKTGSTMDDVRRAAEAGAEQGLLVVAEEQTAGRGARGHRWSSPPGQDLYLSFLLRTPLSLPERPPLTLAVGLGLAEAVEELTGLGARVKWPNDLWIDGAKCAGVLVENAAGDPRGDAVVVGVGLNVNREFFPPPLTETASSLRRLSGRRWDRGELLCAALARVELRLAQVERGGLASTLADLEGRLAFRGHPVVCGDERGTLQGVSPTGHLVLSTPKGEVQCLTGPLRPA